MTESLCEFLPCGHPKSDETSADGYTFCAVCAVKPESLSHTELARRVETIRENLAHIARGCRASTAHNPAPYLNSIEGALTGLLAARDAWDWELEARAQMASKLEAQQCLRLICEAIDLPLDKLAEGWKASLPIILAQFETVVDEAERGFRERDQYKGALEMVAKIIRNSREAPNVLDTIAFTTREALK